MHPSCLSVLFLPLYILYNMVSRMSSQHLSFLIVVFSFSMHLVRFQSHLANACWSCWGMSEVDQARQKPVARVVSTDLTVCGVESEAGFHLHGPPMPGCATPRNQKKLKKQKAPAEVPRCTFRLVTCLFEEAKSKKARSSTRPTPRGDIGAMTRKEKSWSTFLTRFHADVAVAQGWVFLWTKQTYALFCARQSWMDTYQLCQSLTWHGIELARTFFHCSAARAATRGRLAWHSAEHLHVPPLSLPLCNTSGLQLTAVSLHWKFMRSLVSLALPWSHK